MEKIKPNDDLDELILKTVVGNQTELIDLFTKLAIRVARLEVYYKAHRKEHEKR